MGRSRPRRGIQGTGSSPRKSASEEGRGDAFPTGARRSRATFMRLGIATPRAMRSGVIDAHSEKNGARAGHQPERGCEGARESRAAPSSERGDSADRVADAEHQRRPQQRRRSTACRRRPAASSRAETSPRCRGRRPCAQTQAPPGTTDEPRDSEGQGSAEDDQVDPAGALAVGRARE